MAARRRQIVGAVLLIATTAVLFGGAALWARHGRARAACPVAIGERLPEMRFVSASGEATSTRTLAGRSSMLVFGTPDCPACNIDVPAWQAVARVSGGTLAVWSITVGTAAKKMRPSSGLAHHALVDSQDAFATVLKASQVPLVILVDADGVVRGCFTGITAAAVKERAVRSLVSR